MGSLDPLLNSDVLLSSSRPSTGSLMLFLKKNGVITVILQMMKLRHKGTWSAKCTGSVEENKSQFRFSSLF